MSFNSFSLTNTTVQDSLNTTLYYLDIGGGGETGPTGPQGNT